MQITKLEQRDFFGDVGATVHCTRCGVRCQVRGGGDDQARIARFADHAGLCATCVTAWWFQHGPLAQLMTPDKRHMLTDPRVQTQFVSVLQASGHEDLQPDQIKWERLVAQWDLPFPQAKRTRGKR
jgi:hypothetical protein